MDVAKARRVTLDISSHDPEVLHRIVRAAMREYDEIRAERDLFPEGIVVGDAGRVYWPREYPAWGTIRYRPDPKKRTL